MTNTGQKVPVEEPECGLWSPRSRQAAPPRPDARRRKDTVETDAVEGTMSEARPPARSPARPPGDANNLL